VAGRILGAVDRWAAADHDALAVEAADGTLTFGQLRDEARRLADVLRRAGAGPEVAVGLCLGRSRSLVPALLAVWRAGAAAVLVDDRDPPQRLRFVLRDAGVRLVLGDRLPPEAIPPQAHVMTAGAAATRRPGRHGPHRSAGPAGASPDAVRDNCAYVIYTSGTTGRPKGVEITYGGLDTFLAALAGLDLAAGGAGLNVVSPAFDGWLWCTLLYLLHGQAVVMGDPSPAGPGAAGFAALLAAVRPRTVCLTPSLLATVVHELPPVETLVVAGEPCPPGLLDSLPRDQRVLNVYGPTEATIAATWADTGRGDDARSIGRPLPGYRAHVLDEELRPVEDGACGELYLGGPALARGYRGQSRMTASRFVPDPLRGDGSRMYRTGDLARRRPDGAIEHLGRRDDQVKIRGFRVELGELERTASQVPGVGSAAAFVLGSGDALGLALVPSRGADPTLPDRVRGHCAAELPEHLRAAVVLVTGALPTTGTGKVDRAALAAEVASAPPVAGRPPTTERERLVCQVWSRLLPQRVDDVDIGFFDAGGHSLLAAQAVSALRQETGLRITMRSLLANPTAAGLAQELDRLAAADPVAGRPTASGPAPATRGAR
jgi:amino acid adenylation domain-containing protein